MPDTNPSAFDAITLEIYWNRLISIADEAATGLPRFPPSCGSQTILQRF